MKQFLSLAGLPREEIVELLALAARLEKVGDPQALAGKILGLLFFNPSLRTLASKPELRGRGLPARFLYAMPVSTVGFREVDPPPPDPLVLDGWSGSSRAPWRVVRGGHDGDAMARRTTTSRTTRRCRSPCAFRPRCSRAPG